MMVMKSLPPLKAPRQRIKIAMVLKKSSVALTMLLLAYKLAAAARRSSKCVLWIGSLYNQSNSFRTGTEA
jgi:hypothetical protein